MNTNDKKKKLPEVTDYKSRDALLALYSAVQTDIAYYRGWEWSVTIYYALLSTGLIGIVTSEDVSTHLKDWHYKSMAIIQVGAIFMGIFHLYKIHSYLSWNRQLRNRIENILGFFDKGVYFADESVLPISFNQRKSYFLFELKEFIFPFALILIAYQILAVIIILKA